MYVYMLFYHTANAASYINGIHGSVRNDKVNI